MQFINHLSPLTLANGLTLANRIVVPPMASMTADSHGLATEATFAHYENLARSGAGLIFVEYSHVHASGKSEPNQLAIDSPATISGLTRIAALIKRSGARAGMQITHAGGKSDKAIAGAVLLGPSATQVPTVNGLLEPMTAMTADDIPQYQGWYLAAAERAFKAGFDIVELHCAHGYGLNQWLSPITNQRTDEYGDTLENRARMVTEIVSRIRYHFPELLVSVRFPGQDQLDGGASVADMQATSQLLRAAGVSLFNVSNGLGGWRRPRDRAGEGYLVDEAAAIQRVLPDVPVIGVGGIASRSFVDAALQAGRISLAAVGRAMLRDPPAFLLGKSGGGSGD